MTTSQAEAIVAELESLDVEAEVYSNYSGRGMFGKTCAGIVCGSGEAVLIGYAAGLVGVPPQDLPRRCETMGLDVIYY